MSLPARLRHLRSVAALVAGLIAAGAGQAPRPAVAQEKGPAGAPAPQPPIHVTAEEAEYRNAESIVVFTGKVVAVQGDTTLTAARMEVRFTPAPAEGGLATATGGDRRITGITAIDAVTFRQVDPQSKKERYATGDRGDYDAAAQTLTLTGSPRLWEDKNVLTGERIVFHLDTRLFKAQGKVNMTVFPDEKPGIGAPR